MIIVDGILISEEIRDMCFSCDLEKCRGGCCVEGDAGAPLEEEEISMLEDHIEEIIPFMAEEGIGEVKKTGVFDYDIYGQYVTPLVNGRECVFVFFDNGIARCAIEAAFQAGKVPFAKPISCHLYPVRIIRTGNTEGLNYHRWFICEAARKRGKENEVRLYMFLKESLVRKYGEEWYEKLLREIE